jgi:hypothetical protein
VLDTEKIFYYKKQISDLLNERPEYRPFQDRITQLLDNAGSQHNRLVLIHKLMMEKFEQLREELTSMSKL